MLLLFILSGLALSVASNFEALSAADAKQSKIGTLVYSSLSDGTQYHLFKNYRTEHKRQYADMDEEARRYSLFKQSLAAMDKRNAVERANNGTAVFGITVFADLSPEEFRSKYLGTKMSNNPHRRLAETVVRVEPYTGTETEADWRPAQASVIIHEPERCAACWAFSATAQIQADARRARVNRYNDPELSVQQVVRCTYSDRNGCDGGDQYQAYDKVTELGGITTDWRYPYNEANTFCDTTKSNYVATVTKINRILTEQEMIDYVLTKGTLAVVVAGIPWFSYVSGIFSSCTSADELNHGVNIVGVNIVEKYWIVRNNWGPSWGENGWIKLAMGVNMCGITANAHYLDVAWPNRPSMKPVALPKFFPVQLPPTKQPQS